MGYYIDPEKESKENFLKTNGEEINWSVVKKFDYSQEKLPVCLVDNGAFTAAGIVYDRQEAEAFLNPDGRPKRWFLVPKGLLSTYLPERLK